MTGWKPATANLRHLQPHRYSSGNKANTGRELQPSPHLCILLPLYFPFVLFSRHVAQLHSSFFIAAALLLTLRFGGYLSPILTGLFTENTLTFFEDKHQRFTSRQLNTPLVLLPHPNKTFFVSFQQFFMLVCFYETENIGYALPICNAGHTCIFGEKKIYFKHIIKKRFYFLFFKEITWKFFRWCGVVWWQSPLPSTNTSGMTCFHHVHSTLFIIMSKDVFFCL